MHFDLKIFEHAVIFMYSYTAHLFIRITNIIMHAQVYLQFICVNLQQAVHVFVRCMLVVTNSSVVEEATES